MDKQTIEKMKRHELIFEIKKYIRPTQLFHGLLEWKTENIRALLLYYMDMDHYELSNHWDRVARLEVTLVAYPS